MNKTFKTIWNDVRRCYIVANEAQRSHGKPSKSAVALAVAATALFSTVASAAYVEPGFVAQNSSQVDQAVQSWETDEYKADWGLGAMHASKAYALGYRGQGVAVGVMDSGALLQKHPDLAGDRFHASEADSHYGSSGDRYPQASDDKGSYSPDKPATESGKIDGNWIAGTNDSHGTHVTGSVGANRDGSEFHGVAWGADVWVGNTGGTDSTNYGPFQDYTFFYNGWKALADNLIAANGADRGGVINNSFGTNIRVESNGSYGPDGGNTGVHFPTDTISQAEYEYFLFKQMYGDGPSFVDAAYDAVKGTNVVQIFTTGNRDFANPFYRPLAPYFNPEMERNWIAVAGLQKDSSGDGKYKLVGTWNEAGLAKYWTVVAPGSGIYGSKVDADGNPYWGNSSGTSMSAPHVAGAMAVLMSRYQDMSAVQVRDVLFTTANHKNEDGTNYEGWTAEEGEVDIRYGWGNPDLDKGMYGLGQLSGHFDYNMAKTKLDVWSNDISQVALDQREREELAWKSAAEKWLKNPTLDCAGLTEDEKKLLGEVFLDTDDDVVGIDADKEKVSEKDAIAWRTEYYNKRLEAINAKIEQGLYDGSLTKRGQGTLVMTGNNTYRGGTTVEEGTLLGFNESFGVTGDDATATANGKVEVNGGIFGVMNAYNDQFTMKGEITEQANGHSVDVTVNAGGTYGVVAGQDVTVGNLTFKEGAGVTVVSTDSDVLVDAFNSKDGVTGSVTADKLEGAELAVANPDYAFFDTDIKVEGNKLSSTLTRNDDSVAAFARTASGAAIASVLEANTDSKLFASVVDATKQEMANTLDSLSSDMHMAAQNATIVNTTTLARTIKDQANAFGQARTAKLDNGAQIWATGVGNWSNVDAGGASVDMDVDYYAGLVGGEVAYGNGNKVGAFFGTGTTEYDASVAGKIESNDIHFGVYGENDWDAVGVTYGFTYTNQDRDSKRSLLVKDEMGFNAVNYDAEVMQVFGEVSYKGFNTDTFSVEPYAGLSYMRVSADDFTEKVAGHEFKTQLDDQNVGTVNVGVRGAMPFSVGSVNMAVKGDVGYMQFFGDKESTAKMTLGDAGTANLKGEELSGMGAVGFGVDAALGKNTTLGVSYTGAFGSDITSHGVGATLRVKF